MITSPVQFSPLMAASQFKRHIIGTAARLLNASMYIVNSHCDNYVLFG
jgi:hypothetical protein